MKKKKWSRIAAVGAVLFILAFGAACGDDKKNTEKNDISDISRDNIVQVTAMYIGKDELGRYNFVDKGNFILSKEFLERGKVTIDKEFNQDDAVEIYSKVRTKLDKQHKKDLSR